MSRFIRVTKDNRDKDRGFIAVDAICAVFENQDSHNTEIMTMDGFWYEVVDNVEKVYADVTSGEKKKDVDSSTDKFHFAKKMRLVAPTVSEESPQKRHDKLSELKRNEFSYQKKRNSQKKHERGRSANKIDFPSGEGEGQHGSMLKAVDFTPPDTDGL